MCFPLNGDTATQRRNLAVGPTTRFPSAFCYRHWSTRYAGVALLILTTLVSASQKPSPSPPRPAAPPLNVALGQDATFGAAEFNYSDSAEQQPTVKNASNKVKSSLAGAVLKVLAQMDTPNSSTIYAAQLLGTTFTIGGVAGASRKAVVTFKYDDYAATEASAGDKSSAEATYTINAIVEKGAQIRGVPVARNTIFDLKAQVDRGPGHDVQGGNTNKNQESSITTVFTVGKTYTAAIQVKADGTLKGKNGGGVQADGLNPTSDPTEPYQLTLKEISIRFE